MSQNKTVLITGANRGIGLEVAKQLREKGMNVILTARDESKGNEAAKKTDVEFMQLDVSDRESISNLVEEFKTNDRQIDVLVNNAGIIGAGFTSLIDTDFETIENTLHTNSLGALYMVQLVQDLMPDGSIVVNVSSGAGEFCSGFNSAYGIYAASKTLMNVFTRMLADNLAPRDIQVNSVCPGWVRTDMGGSSAPRSVEKGAETIVWLASGGTEQTGKFFRDMEEIGW